MNMIRRLWSIVLATTVVATLTVPAAAAPVQQGDDWAKVKAAGKIVVGTSSVK